MSFQLLSVLLQEQTWALLTNTFLLLLRMGSVQEYEVDKGEVAETDKAKLSVAGSRIPMTGQLGGETIHATLVIEEGEHAAPVAPTVRVGGESVAGPY